MTHDTVTAPLPAPGSAETGEADPGSGVAAAVREILERFLATAAADLAELDPATAPLATAARGAVLGGGKRLRPRIAYWGWRGVVVGSPAPDPLLPAFAALELLHTFALVHDDVMDRSPTRRGRPTARRALADAHRAGGLRGDPDRYGDAAAILVGDLLLVWADQLMAMAAVPADILAGARRSYERMRVEAIAGQFLDVLGEASPAWSVEQALRTARLKTASYTVVRPLLFGAALGGVAADHPVGRAYTRYGTAVGEAFQLRDDLLGVYGEPAVTGKPVGEDLLSGKPTVLLQLARERAGRGQSAELERLLLRRRPEDLPRLAAVLAATGAVAEVGRMIDQRVADAREALATAPVHPQARAALTGLSHSAAWRAG